MPNFRQTRLPPITAASVPLGQAADATSVVARADGSIAAAAKTTMSIPPTMSHLSERMSPTSRSRLRKFPDDAGWEAGERRPRQARGAQRRVEHGRVLA